jgi:hypothetical protein
VRTRAARGALHDCWQCTLGSAVRRAMLSSSAGGRLRLRGWSRCTAPRPLVGRQQQWIAPAVRRRPLSTVNPALALGRLNHLAVAVPDLEASISLYRDVLGAKVSEPESLPEHGVTVVFVELPNTKIELLYPYGDKSPIQGFLDKNPAGGASCRPRATPSVGALPCFDCARVVRSTLPVRPSNRPAALVF